MSNTDFLRVRLAKARADGVETMLIVLDDIEIIIQTIEEQAAEIEHQKAEFSELEKEVNNSTLFGFDGAIGVLQNARQVIIQQRIINGSRPSVTPEPEQIEPTTVSNEDETDGSQENKDANESIESSDGSGETESGRTDSDSI